MLSRVSGSRSMSKKKPNSATSLRQWQMALSRWDNEGGAGPAGLQGGSVAAMDFLIVPTVGFRLLFVLVILRHQRQRLISLTVTTNLTAEWIAHQITDAFPWNEAPDYLSLLKTPSALA